jgi:hypothetical protein
MDYDAKIKEMTENAKKFENAYIKCIGTIEFLTIEKERAQKESSKDKKKDK